MTEHEEHVFAAIYARRSIRRYQDGRPVGKDKIIKLLEAAMAAPSACNIQPWEFVVVDDAPTIDAIKASIPQYANYNAPLVIVVCGSAEFIPWDDDCGEADCCAAVENMLIAATAMGLGSVWIGGFDPAALHAILDIPEQIKPVAVVYFGYPAEKWEPRTKHLDAAVHWSRFDRSRPREPRPGDLINGRR